MYVKRFILYFWQFFHLYRALYAREILSKHGGGGYCIYLAHPTHERDRSTRQAFAKDFQRVLFADKSNTTPTTFYISTCLNGKFRASLKTN